MSMTEYNESDALPAGPVIERTAGGEGPLSLREAARSLADTRYKEQAKAETPAAPVSAPAEEAAPVQAEQESAGEADAAPPETEAPSETEANEPAEAQPPIDPPRSWTKEEREEFKTYPREAQEKIARREQDRERTLRQSQNEAAEKLKGLTAKEQAVEQVRNQYEHALPMLLQSIQEIHSGEFSDIKSAADMERLAREDWPRYIQWDASQKKIAAVQQEVQAAEKRQALEKSTKLKTFIAEQDALFLEKAPELSDSKKAAEIGNSAVTMLKDLGFTPAELSDLWSGDREVSIRDHRVQLLIRDAVRYREAKAAAKTVTAAPKPPVQRPGSAPTKGSSREAQIQTLTQQLDKATGLNQIRLAAQLTSLRRGAAR
jgi:hypothetical protein